MFGGYKSWLAGAAIAIAITAFVGTAAIFVQGEGVSAVRPRTAWSGTVHAGAALRHSTPAAQTVAYTTLRAVVDGARAGRVAGVAGVGGRALAWPAPTTPRAADRYEGEVGDALRLLHQSWSVQRGGTPYPGEEAVQVSDLLLPLGNHSWSGLPPRCRERPWQPRCVRELTTAPPTPGRLPRGCRDVATHPTVRDRVKCVWYAAGMASQWPVADCVAWRESRYTPWAVSPTNDLGIYQFHSPTWDWLWAKYGTWSDEVNNATAATWVVATYGWSPWRADGSCGI